MTTQRIQTPVDLLISIDTSTSMAPFTRYIIPSINSIISNITTKYSNIKIGIILHGDDTITSNYSVKTLDFTTEIPRITSFMYGILLGGNSSTTSNYERALNTARSLNWTPGSTKIFIVCGDKIPHSSTYRHHDTNKSYDYVKDLGLLTEMGVKIYGVCPKNTSQEVQLFFKDLVSPSKGFVHFIETPTNILSNIIDKSLTKEIDTPKKSEDKTIQNIKPSLNNTFREFNTDCDCIIQDFVVSKGYNFKAGNSYYELTKPEKINKDTEIIICYDSLRILITGTEARKQLGITEHDTSISPKMRSVIELKNLGYTVFVQSNSYNRILKANTRFLYKV